MAAHRKTKRKPGGQPQVLAMALIGSGLLVLGVLTLMLLPKSQDVASSDSQISAVPIKVDYQMPELSLQDLDGKAVSLADLNGRVILVNNWATWCPPCKAEMPTLQAYFEDHHKQHFTVIGIEAGESASEVARFVQEYGLSFPVWPDPGQKSLEAFRNLSLPNSYVIDKTGKVRLAWTGAISRDMLEKYVTPLLEE